MAPNEQHDGDSAALVASLRSLADIRSEDLRPGTTPDREGSAEVTLSFDLDGEAGPASAALNAGESPAARIGRLSGATYGLRRGVTRILDVLGEYEVAATFFVPGITVELHPEVVTAIANAGHEIAHHGYSHRSMVALTEAEQRFELEQGIAAHEAVLGKPRGYRAPGWELTARAFKLVAELGFDYDSSLMGDDRPYRAVIDGKELLEFPVHWSLDDWPFLGYDGHVGQLGDPEVALAIWLSEFASAAEESRHVTYTMHPDVMGRGHRIGALAKLVKGLREGGAVFTTHLDLAERIHRSCDGS